jgi:hypothetical protein
VELEEFSYSIEISERFRKSCKEILDYILIVSFKFYTVYQKEITERIAHICEHPESFTIFIKVKLGKLFRFAKFKQFKIFFFVEKNSVFIVDIIHEKRSPKSLNFIDKV